MAWLQGLKLRKVTHLHRDKVQEYWQTLYMHDLLKQRICNVKNPTWTDAQALIATTGECMMYSVLDDKIISEFTVEPISGKTFLVHFSFHPDLPIRKKLQLGRFLCGFSLFEWQGVDTLIGLTPVSNKVAVKFALATGFKFVAVIPSGQEFDGQVTDAVLTMLSKGDFNGWRQKHTLSSQ